VSTTDPSGTILTWREFGTVIDTKITELAMKDITNLEDLNAQFILILNEILEIFEDYMWQMLQRGIIFAVEQMNRIDPRYHFSITWTPTDDTLLTELMKGCGTYLTNWRSDLRTEAAKEIDIGINAGESVEQIGARITSAINASKSRGVLIARTELMRAFNKAAEDRYTKAGFKLKWVTAYDPEVCELCMAMEGKILTPDDPRPPLHPNCRCTIIPVLES